MKIAANENGIVIKKLFKDVEIPYGSIEKIVVEDQISHHSNRKPVK